jgi:hypothetical protein
MLIIGFVILYLVYSHFINSYLHNIGKDHYNDEARVYDICHIHLPNYEKYEFIGNIYIAIVFLFILYKPSKTVSIIFDLLAFIIPIYFIRSILTLITVLPKSSECKYNPSFAFINGGCYDKIFSGHTAIIFVLTLLLNKYKIEMELNKMRIQCLQESVIQINLTIHFKINLKYFMNNIKRIFHMSKK